MVLWAWLVLLLVFNGATRADHIPPQEIYLDVPRDAIPPLDQPEYDPVAETTWLSDADWVIGFEHEGDAHAYPVKIMNWHEIVNDVVGGLEVVVTYCPLCRSGLVFDRRLDQAQLSPEAQGALPAGSVLSFGNTGALYESDLVMYDRQTQSDWFQVGGTALRGPLHGTRLARLPTMMLTWEQWKALYPASQVLSRDTGHDRPYTQDAFELLNYNKRTRKPEFPVSRLDPRADPKARVLGLSFEGESKAYDVEQLPDGAYADQLGGRAVALWVQGGAAVAYSPWLEGRILTFSLQSAGFVDAQTGSNWDLSGKATGGPLQGKQLERLVQTNAFWFSWALAQPDTELISDAQAMTPYVEQAAFPGWEAALALAALLALVVWGVRRRGRKPGAPAT